MKLFLSGLTVSLLILSSSAFAVTTEECQAAWKSSSAYKSCSPGWGTKAIGNMCIAKNRMVVKSLMVVTWHITIKKARTSLAQIIRYFIRSMNLKSLIIAMVN